MALTMRELREESTQRLREMLAETKDALFKHGMKTAAGEETAGHDAKNMRRDIARLETVLRAVEVVCERTGADENAARGALESSNWDVTRAVKAAASTGTTA